MRYCNYQDDVYTFEGCISLEENNEWVRPWRIPYDAIDFYPVLSEKQGRMNACVRICFTTDSENILLDVADPSDGMMFDLLINGQLVERNTLSDCVGTMAFKVDGQGDNDIEIWLDHHFDIKLRGITIDENASISKTENRLKRWVHYGSSISQTCLECPPSELWTAKVARRVNYHISNLGFAGNCKLEPVMAMAIRDLPSDYITLNLGINLWNGDLSQRTFTANTIGFIHIIREKNPDVPIAIVSPFFSVSREQDRSCDNGMTLEEMRADLYEIVCLFQQKGDDNIHYIDGLEIFGGQFTDYLPDGLHPNYEAQEIIAQNYKEKVFGKL